MTCRVAFKQRYVLCPICGSVMTVRNRFIVRSRSAERITVLFCPVCGYETEVRVCLP